MYCRNAGKLVWLWLALALWPSSASAQSAAAEALFEEGRKLMDAQDYAAACPKLAESHRIEPALGALLNLGTCYELAGQTASAWSAFKDAASLAREEKSEEREAYARDHIAALEPRLTKLRITLAPGANVDGLKITQGGVDFSVASVGTPIPIDPGTRDIAASAPGHAPWKKTILLGGEGAVADVEIPALQRSVASPVPATPAPTPDAASGGTSGIAIAGWVIAGVGVASGIVGGVFGGLAIKNGNEVDEGCTEPGGSGSQCPNEDLVNLNDKAQTQALLSNILLIGGGVLAAGGILMIVLAPDETEVAENVYLAPTPDGLRLRF